MVAALAALSVLIVADRQGWLLVRRPDDLANYQGLRARVVSVVDGDTLEIDVRDALNERPTTQVRLWGLDCPEPARFERPAEPGAEEARAFAQALALDQVVTLSLESHRPRGTLGRILAHVELPDGSSLNEELLAAGVARIDDRWPHSRLTRYAQAERAARRQEIGLWAPPEGDTPSE